MLKGLPFWLMWIGLIIYAFFLAPPDQPDTPVLIENLIRGNWQNINPAIVALFCIMGIWPCIYGCVLFRDGQGQKVPAWPFVLLAMGVGAFGLLPYLALRKENPTLTNSSNWWLRCTDSRITGLILTASTIGFLVYGMRLGDWQNFALQWQTNRFIHVMSLDFVMLSLLFLSILGDDLKRRGLNDHRSIFVSISLVPLIGPLVYLTLRPDLPKVVLDNHISTKQN